MFDAATAGQVRCHMDAAVNLLRQLGWERWKEDRPVLCGPSLPLFWKTNRGKVCKAVVGPTVVTVYDLEGPALIDRMESVPTHDVGLIRAKALDIGGL